MHFCPKNQYREKGMAIFGTNLLENRTVSLIIVVIKKEQKVTPKTPCLIVLESDRSSCEGVLRNRCSRGAGKLRCSRRNLKMAFLA